MADIHQKEGGNMQHTLANVNQPKRRPVVKNPVKLTALLYLKEALTKQWYELCPEIIGIAKEFGASDSEVHDLLEDPRRRPG